MGMVPAQHVTDTGRGLAEGAVRGQIVLVHSVEDPSMDGFETVPGIGQGTSDDDGHGILDVRGFHFMNKLRGDDSLIREHDILGLVIFLVLCQ